MKNIVRYGLYHVGQESLLGFGTSPGGDDLCVNVEFDLETHTDNVWLVKTEEHAKRVSTLNPEYYNRDYNTPGNSYAKDSPSLKVVKITLQIEEC